MWLDSDLDTAWVRRMVGVFLAFVVCSCVREYESEPLPVGFVQYPAEISVSDPQIMTPVKSSYTDGDITRLTDLNIFVYHQGRLVDECCRYYDDVSDVMLSFPCDRDGYDIYMLGNVGRVEAPDWETEISSLQYVVGNYGDFRIRGVPVAGAFHGYMKGDPACFTLKRMVGQFNIRMKVSASEADYTIKSIKVMNCARDIYPFSDDTKAEIFTSGQYGWCMDELTDEDVRSLNGGGTVALYFMENLQGNLLEGNTDPRKKIPSSLPKGAAECCTYVEITADITTAGAKYSEGKYRFYPGEDEVSDFSIRRNTLYDVYLDFTQNMVNEEEWRIEVPAPEISEVLFSKKEVNVSPARSDTVYVYSPTGDIERMYDLDCYVGSGLDGVCLHRFLSEYKGYKAYMFVVSVDENQVVQKPRKHQFGVCPDPLAGYGIIESSETYNGTPLLSERFKINCYNDVYPLLLKLEKQPGAEMYRVTLRGHNPMKHKISVSADYTYAGKTASVRENTVVDISEEPVYLGYLNIDVCPQNLSRIDFTIKIDGVPVGLGEDCGAVYGPDSDMYPALFDHFTDGGMMRIVYADEKLSYVPLMEGVSKDVKWVKIEESGTDHATPDLYFSSRVYIHHPDNDHYQPFVVRGVNSRPVKEGSFYFMNGCLESYRVHATRGEMVKYPKEAWSGAVVYYWGSGRDLFVENANGSVVEPTHMMGFWITEWWNLLDKYKSRFETLYYNGQLYMTINNCSCWPGADVSQFGCYPDTD